MNSMMAPSQPIAGAELFDRILAADGGLISLCGEDEAVLVDQFRSVARHSGQAVYHWQADLGLCSLRDAHARVPGCERLGGALRYMQQSMHFGVYLLCDLPLPLSAADLGLFKQLSSQPVGHVRRVVLINAPDSALKLLREEAIAINAQSERVRRPRLRDGRWQIAPRV